MTRLGFVLAVVLGLASASVSAPAMAQDDRCQVTGAGEAIFPDGATLNGLTLKRLDPRPGTLHRSRWLGGGPVSGGAPGHLTPWGAANVTLEGEVRDGFIGGDGSATFNGTATVDMGDGTLPLPGVPFTVTVSTGASR